MVVTRSDVTPSPVYVCLNGGTLSGSSCACVAPEIENSTYTSCYIPSPPANPIPLQLSGSNLGTPKKCNMCPCPTGTALSDGEQTPHPILPATGEKILAQPDYTGLGADALSLVRHYRSSWAGAADRGLPVDPGLTRAWAHNHAISVKQEGTPGTTSSVVRVIFGDGSVRTFSWNVTTSSWDAGNSADSLTANSTGLLYKSLDDDSQWQFDAGGKLLTVTQRNGWVNTYTYSTGSSAAVPAANLLVSVSNQFGRSLSFAYNGTSQLVRVTASDGQVISYTYDGTSVTSHLTTVSYPDLSGGTVTRIYHYENVTYTQLVTGITDERGIRLSTVVYDSQGRAISSAYAGGVDLYNVSYGAAGTATVTDPLGTQRTYNYSTNKGQLAVTGADKPSGNGNSSAASRVQDVNGFITQESDFLGVNTMYTWDINRRLPLTTTKAAGLPEVQTTTTQWHPTFRLPVLVTEAGRTTAYTYDAQGNQLSQTVTDTATSVARTSGWTYVSNGSARGLVATQSSNGIVRQTYAYYGNTSFSGTESNIDPELSHVSLLLNGAGIPGSIIVDSSPSPKPLTRLGNAQISAAQSKFGYSSIFFGGNGSSVSTPSATDFQFGSGDFTIETWVYQTNRNNGSYGAYQHVVGQYEVTVNSNTSFALLVADGRPEAAFWSGGAVAADVSAANPLPLNTWVHLAAVRSGNLVTLYIDGVSVGSAALTTSLDVSTRNVTVGADSARQIGLSGYLSDLRITKGFARYTANFTPPVKAFSDTTPVIDPNAVGHTAGDLQSITNAAGHITQFTLYDRAGRVRQMVDPKGIITDMAYTPRGWISSTTVTPPGGAARTTTYTYDNAGQMTGVTLPDTTTMSYSYDAAHRLTGVTDAKGNTVTYTLDAMGNKTGEQVKDPSGNLQKNITRVYDALNRVQQVTGASN